MLAYCILPFLSLFSAVFAQDDATLNYYEDLVNKYSEQYTSFNVPRNNYQFRPRSNQPSNYGQFDFIVVGSGAGGSVMARRLSEVRQWKVLLLEAGQLENNFTDIPSMYFYLAKSPYSWGYQTSSQQNACLGMRNNKCEFLRGKGLGGTTIINGLVYNRGNVRDYDDWARDNPGWNFTDVLPFYKYAERSNIIGDLGYHGTDGLLNVEYNCVHSPQLQAFLEANQQLGRNVLDYNGRQQLGVSPTQMNTIRGSRLSTARAYLRGWMDNRSNLEVSVGSYVTQILTSGSGKGLKAYGVTFSKNGRLYTATAKREVILSAGSVASPQILMLSGIGPAAELRRNRIEVKADLPVGRNLQDHTTFYGVNVETNYSEPIRSVREYLAEYLQGCGPYSIPGNNQGLGFLQSRYARTPGVPDLEVMMIPSNRTNPVYQDYMDYTDETYKALANVIDNTRTFIIYVILLNPLSVGTVTLNSSDPYEHPVIDPKYLSNERDLDVLYDGVRLVNEMLRQTPFQRLRATLRIARLPACLREHRYESPGYLRCFIRHTTANIYHPVGTNKMGSSPRTGGVVDNRLRVHGVQNLRVVDGSVIPFSLKSHPCAPIMMVAEKAACFIKQQYNGGDCFNPQ